MNPKSNNGYILVYIWNVIAIFYMLNSSLANDTLYSWFAHNISAQFRILSLRFKTTALTSRSHGDERKFTKSIISQVEYHNRAIELANTFNEIFVVTVFFQLLISFLQISFYAFQIARVKEFSRIVYFILCLTSVSFELMLFCRGGQRIIDAVSIVL